MATSRVSFRLRPQRRAAALVITAALCLGVLGCRGTTSTDPPVHLQRNMATQQKYKPQSESRWFEDGSTMRTPVENTVARGDLRENDALYTGKSAGQFVDSPVPFTAEILARGEERYGIYCRPCHGALGNGRGKIMEYNYPIPPTSYFDPRILAMKDGGLFDVITNGVRSMPSYRQQIPVEDRWAIVGHVRRLQQQQLPDSLKGIIQPTQISAK